MKWFILSSMVLVVGMLLFDFIFKEFPSNPKIEYPPTPSAELSGHLEIGGVRQDVQTHKIRGVFHLSVRSRSSADIHNLVFSAMETGSKKLREWFSPVLTQDCRMETHDEVDDQQKRVAAASLDCKETTLLSGWGAKEIWYPFDSYQVILAPMSCVNESGGACIAESGTRNISIDSFEITFADQSFVGSLREEPSQDRHYKLILSRRPFFPLVSLIFLILSLIFLWYLATAGDPSDLLPKSLGFFATLWGLRSLIVPSAVNIFPTLVDYAILTIFVILFFLILFKLKAGSEKPWERFGYGL